MPQVLRVVRCCQCRQFQSDIVKKATKWTCVRCNTKQTLRKEYGRGSGLQCRQLAQQLSTQSCQSEDLLDRSLVKRLLQDDFDEILPDESPSELAADQPESAGTSKWESFLKKDDPEEIHTEFLREPLPQSSTFQSPDFEPDTINRPQTSWQPKRTHPIGQPQSAKKVMSKSIPLVTSLPQSSKFENSNFEPFKMESPSFNRLPQASWQPKRTHPIDQPQPAKKVQPQSIPLMDFHQMNRQDKKQFKWESRNNSTNISSAHSQKPQQGQPLFSFKPKIAKSLKSAVPEQRVDVPVEVKRESDEAGLENEAGFSKIFKLQNSDNLERVPVINSTNEVVPRVVSSGGGSKWSKFVVKEENDDGIIKTN